VQSPWTPACAGVTSFNAAGICNVIPAHAGIQSIFLTSISFKKAPKTDKP